MELLNNKPFHALMEEIQLTDHNNNNNDIRVDETMDINNSDNPTSHNNDTNNDINNINSDNNNNNDIYNNDIDNKNKNDININNNKDNDIKIDAGNDKDNNHVLVIDIDDDDGDDDVKISSKKDNMEIKRENYHLTEDCNVLTQDEMELITTYFEKCDNDHNNHVNYNGFIQLLLSDVEHLIPKQLKNKTEYCKYIHVQKKCETYNSLKHKRIHNETSRPTFINIPNINDEFQNELYKLFFDNKGKFHKTIMADITMGDVVVSYINFGYEKVKSSEVKKKELNLTVKEYNTNVATNQELKVINDEDADEELPTKRKPGRPPKLPQLLAINQSTVTTKNNAKKKTQHHEKNKIHHHQKNKNKS